MDAAAEQRFVEWSSARAAKLQRTAFLLSGDWHVAEDLVQECLVRTAMHWTRIERLSEPDAYVRRILINQASARRRRGFSRERPAATLPDTGFSDGTQERAAHDELLSALAELPRRQRQAVVLRYFEELSEAETADAMNCSLGTVKSNTSRGVTALRRTLTSRVESC